MHGVGVLGSVCMPSRCVPSWGLWVSLWGVCGMHGWAGGGLVCFQGHSGYACKCVSVGCVSHCTHGRVSKVCVHTEGCPRAMCI